MESFRLPAAPALAEGFTLTDDALLAGTCGALTEVWRMSTSIQTLFS
jgi:hypothetical protein